MTEWVVVSILISNLNPGNLSLIDRVEEEKEIISQYLEIRQIYGREINKTKKNKLGKRQKKTERQDYQGQNK